MTATITVDRVAWLDAIARHPKTLDVHVVAARKLLGDDPSPALTDDEMDEAAFWLQLLGFLKVVDISADGFTYTYKCAMS
ncbi:hypothetical protein DAVIS_00397 [Mycobacterium marinum]|uniref:Uncharacterized protein n=1 Tax=Mycobacterium marinum TaxID=1781 RepID=A0A3E2N2U9_MYCMR|nr:hypothetical protein [Mycobacterium marinum]RFZ47682.1 hypothetical protein DAVIS_00397 [Mycobacterium marinum]